MIFLTGGKRMDEKIDKIHELSIKTHEGMLLMSQEQHRIKEDMGKTEAQVEQLATIQNKHSNELEKLTNYSASQKREIDSIKERQSGIEENQKAKQPVWDILGKLWDRFLFVGAGLLAAWFYSNFK